MSEYKTTHIGTSRFQCKKTKSGKFPVVKNNGNYESLLSFEGLPSFEEFEEYGRSWKYTKNYKPVMDRLVLDIDSDNLDTAHDITKNIVKDLSDYYEYINVYFSGGKGFHIEILTEKLDIINTKVEKPSQSCMEYVEFMNYFMDKYPEVDLNLKDVGTRILRIHHTRHEKTGNYKVLVDINAGLDEILESSKANHDMVSFKTSKLSNPTALDLMNKYRLETGKKEPKFKTNENRLEEVNNKYLFDPVIKLYKHLRKYGYSKHEIIGLLGASMNGYFYSDEVELVFNELAEKTDILESDNAKGSFIDAYENDIMPFNIGQLVVVFNKDKKLSYKVLTRYEIWLKKIRPEEISLFELEKVNGKIEVKYKPNFYKIIKGDFKTGVDRLFEYKREKDKETGKWEVVYDTFGRPIILINELGILHFLKQEYEIIEAKNSGLIYIIDDNNKYNLVTGKQINDIIEWYEPKLHEKLDKNLVSKILRVSTDTEREPQTNKAVFNNGVYDFNTMKFKENAGNRPVFSQLNIPYDYNPNAESTICKNYLWTSLYEKDDELTKSKILSVLELCGYLLTSGNKYNLLVCITGIGGSGKTVLALIITAMVGGSECVSSVQLHELNNTHATSAFIGKHLNLIYDGNSTKSLREVMNMVKSVTGNDIIRVEPKFKTPYVLKPENVPKTVYTGNNLPFAHTEDAIMQRLAIINFTNTFRGTDDVDEDLVDKIINNKEEMEWFIYQSIKAYEKVANKEKDFEYKKLDVEKLRRMHSSPVNVAIEAVTDLDELAENDNYNHTLSFKNPEKWLTIDEINDLVIDYAKKNGLNLNLTDKGKVSPNTLKKAIKHIYDIFEDIPDDDLTARVRRGGKRVRVYKGLVKRVQQTLT